MSKVQPPYFGAAYYPEDWPIEQVDEDIRLMNESGMNVMRLGEFAWSMMEPSEGKYNFDWLHLVIDKLGEAGISVILGTPTCTPPIWLSEEYPEILTMNDQGIRAQHGGRKHACPNSPVYREYCMKIVTRMAEEFGRDENVIGWQIDNELYPPYDEFRQAGRGCCCPECRKMFIKSMEERFTTIDELNRAFGNNLWSQAYQSFDQLPIPRSDTCHHPSLLTSWMNFQSDSYVKFAELQADILHKYAKQPVGTDMMPYNGLSYQKIHRKLDLVQFNHYNNTDTLWKVAFWGDFIRTVKDVPFWNTETCTCAPGSTACSPIYNEPGFCRANSWLPIALGGEANLYWLWRSHWSGQELMHGSVISSCGRPLHMYGEIKETAAGFKKSSEFLNGTKPERSGIAIHFSSYSWWFFKFQPIVDGFKDYLDRLQENIYRPLIQAHLRPDIIDPAVSLEPYKLIISSFLAALDESELSTRLKKWIEAGGTWVTGPLSDIRTTNATKFTYAPFGRLEEWAGIKLKYSIPSENHDFKLLWGDNTESKGYLWYDGFELNGAEVMAKYTENELNELAAITRCKMGKGQIVVIGTLLGPDDFQKLILSISGELDIKPAIKADSNLLVVPREGSAGYGLVTVEIENRHGKMKLPYPMTELITDKLYQDEIEVSPHSVMVLKK